MTYIIIAVILFFVLSRPTVKGKIGEAIVKIAIRISNANSNEKDKKIVIHNLVLEVAPDKTSQIDHVIINSNGVFIVETKNYSGRIYGNDAQLNWTQVLNYGKTKNRFYSPVKQNFTHVYVVKSLLPEDTPVIPIVVFVDGDISQVRSKYVTTVRGMLRRMKEPYGKTLTSDEINFVYNTLVEHNKSAVINNAEHIQNIAKMKNDIENNICPRCGAPLVVRHGKRKDFLGCSEYPQCRFTKKID